MSSNENVEMFERESMSRYLKIMIIFIFASTIWLVIINNQTRQSERRIREHFNWRFDSLAVFYKQIPATLYDGNGRCVLVYPDSVLYMRVKGEMTVRRRR